MRSSSALRQQLTRSVGPLAPCQGTRSVSWYQAGGYINGRKLEKTAACYGMEIRQRQTSRQQHQAETICQHVDEWENARWRGPGQIPMIRTNQRQNLKKKKIPDWCKQTLPWQGWQYYGKTEPSVFLQRKSINQSITQSIKFFVTHSCATKPNQFVGLSETWASRPNIATYIFDAIDGDFIWNRSQVIRL